MSRITPEHCSRRAVVYVRQSSPEQVRRNVESRRWQSGMAERARQLGWREVQIIDEDLGRKGDGTVQRSGFEDLLSAVCRVEVGIILAVDATRLARNGREWHTLIEFCGVVGCLIADEQSVYDPAIPTDRAMLGIQGAVSELELSNILQRSLAARRLKAKRGELIHSVPAGYQRVGRDGIEKDPDLRVRSAIELVFRKFSELRSIRQVYLWFLEEKLELPSLLPGYREPYWKLPGYERVRNILSNPIYAGAYAYGRTRKQVSIRDGRKHVAQGHAVAQEDWQVLIKEHHESYLSWDEYEMNQRLIANNSRRSHGSESAGPVRAGEGLLGGLLRCGHCGHRLNVQYHTSGGNSFPRYHCSRDMVKRAANQCIALAARKVDQAIGLAVARALKPIGVEAAILAMEESGQARADAICQKELALERARYEAGRAERQYDAVDPENRQVAGELERRWNDRLAEVRRLDVALEELRAEAVQDGMSAEERRACLALGDDLERAWNHPGAGSEIRKRILRAALVEVVVKVESDWIKLLLHWQGGDHTELAVRRPRFGRGSNVASADIEELVKGLARQLPDESIARLLNRLGHRTGTGKAWSRSIVCSFRNNRRIPVYHAGEQRERDEFTLAEAAERLGVGVRKAYRIIYSGTIPAKQLCKGAPWVISGKDLAALEKAREQPQRPGCAVLEGFDDGRSPLHPVSKVEIAQ